MKKFKLFFLRNKEKLFRFLTVFMSCFVLSFSIFSFSASADSIYNFTMQQPQIDEYSGYIEAVFSNWGPCVVYFRAFDVNGNTFSPVEFNALVSNNTLHISIMWPEVSSSLLVCGWVYSAAGWGNGLAIGQYSSTLSLGNAGSILNAKGYNCSMGDGLPYSEPATFVYGSDTLVNYKLQIIKDAVSSVESTVVETNSINVNKLNHLIELVMTSNSNLSLIQSILQEEGTLTRSKLDTIINYLQAAENGAYYNPSDDGTTGTVTNQQQKDEEVMQGTSTGRTEANNAISGLSGLLTTTGAVFKGSTAMTKVFNLFAQSAYLVPILQISLVLGISSFVLGTAFIVVGKIRNKKE